MVSFIFVLKNHLSHKHTERRDFMERLLFQKTIDLNHQLQELLSVNVKENLNYTLDKEGKRAAGTLNIDGDYLFNKQKKHFEDLIEIDILAPFQRLDEKEDFYVEIQDYDYHITSGNLSLDIHVNAYGVSKKEDRHILIDDEQARYEEIKELLPKQELIETIEMVMTSKEDVLEAQGHMENDFQTQDSCVDDDIFDDDTTSYVSYPFYIVKKEDTYQSIAQNYMMDEAMLRFLNNDQPLDKECIIRLKK